MLKSRYLWFIACALCLFAACETEPLYEDLVEAQFKLDTDLIDRYLAAEKVTMDKTSDGLYYQIQEAGSGEPLAMTDTLKLRYQGYYLFEDDSLKTIRPLFYDSTASTDPALATSLVLQTGMEGWQKGIPLVRKGGKLRLVIPSKYAYQNRFVGKLPKNAVLDFEIDLLDVRPKKPDSVLVVP